jgi:hypothetical protein
VLSANAVQVAPAGLAATLTSASLAGTLSGSGTTFALLKMMTMTKIQAGLLGGIVVAGLLIPLAMQQRSLANLTGQNRALGRRATELSNLPAENQRLSNLLAAVKTAPSLPPDQFSELMRLRGRAGVQRNELEKLRAEAALGPISASSLAERERAAKNYFPKNSWAAAGFATPEATVQAMAWAAGRGDSNAVLACLSPEAQAQLAKLMGDKSAGEVAAEIVSESKFVEKADGLLVVNTQMISDEEAMLTYMFFYNNGTNDVFASSRMKRFGNEWKIAGDFKNL